MDVSGDIERGEKAYIFPLRVRSRNGKTGNSVSRPVKIAVKELVFAGGGFALVTDRVPGLDGGKVDIRSQTDILAFIGRTFVNGDRKGGQLVCCHDDKRIGFCAAPGFESLGIFRHQCFVQRISYRLKDAFRGSGRAGDHIDIRRLGFDHGNRHFDSFVPVLIGFILGDRFDLCDPALFDGDCHDDHAVASVS